MAQPDEDDEEMSPQEEEAGEPAPPPPAQRDRSASTLARRAARAGLAALLDAHGLSRADLGSPDITELEMFMQPYARGLSRIEGLAGCPRLEALWLAENRIACTRGLAPAPRCLRALHLYSNRLTSLAGLEGLAALEVLWVSDNYLSSLAGLGGLTALRELHAARNDVATLGDALAGCTALSALNLADNRISSFQARARRRGRRPSRRRRGASACRADAAAPPPSAPPAQEVAGLSRLPALRELCLADPLWGDCPVASLCNYQTFALAALRRLTALDGRPLADETRAAAAATVARKRLFYAMRARGLRRAAADAADTARAGRRVLGARWGAMEARLACAARALQRELLRQDGGAQQGLAEELAGLAAASEAVAGRQQALAAALEADARAARAALEGAEARLQLELDSGGNVRLEEAAPGDAWLASCQELLRGRLLGAGAPGGGVGVVDIEVVAAAHVHNRHLRLAWDAAAAAAAAKASAAAVGGAADGGAGAGQHAGAEVLLCGETPGLPGDLLRVAQAGFRPPAEECAALGLDGAVRLASCVELADQPRLAAALAGSGAPGAAPLEGQLLVCRALLGGATREAGGCAELLPAVPRPGVPPPPPEEAPPVRADQHPGASAVWRPIFGGGAVQEAAGHRAWYVFDPAAVLPEFLVTFRLTAAAGSPLAAAAAAAGGSPPAELAASAAADPLLRLCRRPLRRWLAAAEEQQEQQQTLPPPHELELERRCEALLAAAAVATPPCTRLDAATPASLAAVAGCAAPQLVALAELSLHDCGLSDGGLGLGGLLVHLPCLTRLCLSFNRLTCLDGLLPPGAPPHGALRALDAAHNAIAAWRAPWLAGCPSLTALDASHNRLDAVAHLQELAGSAPGLLDLDLRGNSVRRHKAYALTLAGALPGLERLDGAGDAAARLRAAAGCCITLALLRDSAARWHPADARGPGEPAPPRAGGREWWCALHSLCLDGRGLTSLVGLGVAGRLVAASLSDNALTALDGLECCTALRELNVSRNLLSDLGPLLRLTALRGLDVGGNAVSSLAPLAGLAALSQLAVDGNAVASLAPLTGLTDLLELYAARNAVTDIREAERLAALPGLLVLDLGGNPVASGGGAGDGDGCADGGDACSWGGEERGDCYYRPRLLYVLRQLKVLDGVPAGEAELAAARAKYAGRLMMSFLVEQLGPGCALRAIACLDVSGLRIRDLGAVFSRGTPFAGLTELVLDGNALTRLAPLCGLTALRTLCVSGNRLGEAEPGAASFALPPAEAGGAPRPLLPGLTALHVGANGLPSLRLLQLGALDGEALAPLARLRELRLEDNALRSLGGLGGALRGLTALHLGGNRLADAADLDRLGALPRLADVSLAGNPLASRPGCRALLIGRCAALATADRQPVTDDERSAAAAMLAPAPVESGPPDAATGLLAAAADARAAGCGWLAFAPPPAPGTGPGAQRASMPAGRLSGPAALAVLDYVQLAAAMPGLGAPGGGGGGAAGSVPTIQSGVLVLSGSAAFGLSGTAISGGRPAKRGGAKGAQSPGGSPGGAAGRRALGQSGSVAYRGY
ncbi:LRRC9 [Scenedesmus sp. PABB004]|nr:LRRC9 [Scenedesmus sp. PABB004]